MHNATSGLLALAKLGLTGWFGYVVVLGVLATSGGRAGAGFGAAVRLAGRVRLVGQPLESLDPSRESHPLSSRRTLLARSA